MFCPKCGSNQGERRFCTVCGTNLNTVSQALHGPLPGSLPGVGPGASQYLAPPLTPYEMERQREYAKGMKMLLLGGAFLAFNILRFILSFGHSSFNGFFAFVGLVLFAIGLARVLSWRQIAGNATNAVLQAGPVAMPEQAPMPPLAAPTPNTAQLNQMPKPVFSAVPPGTRTDELEPARLTHNATPAVSNFAPSVTEDDTRHLPNQKANWKME